jgi:tetratricopeptide (TPR) repeat protein
MLKQRASCFAVGAITLLLGCSGSSSEPNTSAESTPASQTDFDHPPVAPIDADADDAASLEEALEKNPSHTPILLRMAELALQSGDPVAAADHLRKAIEIDPNSLDARLELGRALYESGDREGAIRETDALLQLDPVHVDALYNLGAIYANLGKPDIAIGYWAHAVDVDPQSPSGRNAQAGLNVLMGKQPQIPDIPEHRGIQSGAPTAQAQGLSPQQRNRLIEFAAESVESR